MRNIATGDHRFKCPITFYVGRLRSAIRGYVGRVSNHESLQYEYLQKRGMRGYYGYFASCLAMNDDDFLRIYPGWHASMFRCTSRCRRRYTHVFTDPVTVYGRLRPIEYYQKYKNHDRGDKMWTVGEHRSKVTHCCILPIKRRCYGVWVQRSLAAGWIIVCTTRIIRGVRCCDL